MTKELTQTEIKNKLDSDQTEVTSWENFHSIISRMSDTAWIFRGVSSPKHYPIPSIGRKHFGPYKQAQEERLFKEFKNRAISISPNSWTFDNWHWLAYAQHLGVPTRLLDWTTSPLIAAFFALQSENEEDRLIFSFKYSTYIYEVDTIGTSPFDNKKLGRFTPPLLFDRIRAQRGIFTIHPEPAKIFYRNKMKVIRIPYGFVDEFRRRLFKYGIDYWHIYPDAEGLGQQLRWQYLNKIGLGNLFMNENSKGN